MTPFKCWCIGSTSQILLPIGIPGWPSGRFTRHARNSIRRSSLSISAGFKICALIGRGPSERPLSTEIVGSNGRSTVRALRLRTLLGLRDSLFSFDIERNAQGEVVGMTLYGRGWGHGVGMCQVGAYGDGAGRRDV